MAATAWRIMKANGVCSAGAPGRTRARSNPSRARKRNLCKGRLENVVEPSAGARCRPRARITGAAAAASTSTSRTRRKCATKRKFCARRSGRIGRIQWTGPSKHMPRRRSATAIARNGSCGRSRTARRAAPASAISKMGSTRLCAVTECSILSPRLAETFSTAAA